MEVSGVVRSTEAKVAGVGAGDSVGTSQTAGAELLVYLAVKLSWQLGSLVGAHVIKMMGYIQTLEKLGFALNDELAIDVVLQLLGMLRTAESNMKKG
ncbi:hypothetical protein V6N13_096764 [Hibiscus sabdariffa]